MSLHLVRLADIAAQPWRNGGGATRELLAWPAADDWRLRLSVAQIERDGPFSAFPGVRRFFAVIDGAGVELRFADAVRVVRGADAPLAFDGAAAPGCRLLDGATQDLNLMLSAGAGALHRLRPGVPAPEAGFKALYVADAARLCIDDDTPLALSAGTLAWSAQAAGRRWVIDGGPGLRAWAVAFNPEAAR